MYFRFATLVPVAALVAVAAAAPNAIARDGAQCNASNGANFCCNSTQTSTAAALSSLGGLLGVVLPQIGGLIGLTCTPLTIGGIGTGSTCTQQAVCCTNNNFNGLVNLGCSPINLSL